MVDEFIELKFDDKPEEEVEITEPVKVYKRLPNGEIGEFLRIENGDRKLAANSFIHKTNTHKISEFAMIAEARKEKIAKWIAENKRIPTVSDFYDFLGDDARQSKKSTLYNATRKAIEKHNIKTEFILTNSKDGNVLRFATDQEVAEHFDCKVGAFRNCLSAGVRFKAKYNIEQIIVQD